MNKQDIYLMLCWRAINKEISPPEKDSLKTSFLSSDQSRCLSQYQGQNSRGETVYPKAPNDEQPKGSLEQGRRC